MDKLFGINESHPYKYLHKSFATSVPSGSWNLKMPDLDKRSFQTCQEDTVRFLLDGITLPPFAAGFYRQ
ncbi:hypothetical protein Glove_82g70 [Diversispora epigaea]|uniref:Uncharacterized protein n=1 Tax=Diversispora epigaea TaxID=1348612 RepID=A0A397JAA0_9GLOM|nr:hypothetical protein Glove_82g70 [Diversispora epigaea]